MLSTGKEFHFIYKIILFFLLTCSVNKLYAAYDYPPQLAVNILQAPTPMIAQGKDYLVYELYLTNFHSAPIILNSLEVMGVQVNDAIKFSNEEFAKLIHPVGLKIDDQPLVLQPGITKMVYMWLSFNTLTIMPNQLIHKIAYKTQRNNEDVSLMLIDDPIAINKALPIVVSAPLRGEHWLAGNGPSNTSEHRKANMVINGHDYFAQRYAIDFIQIGDDGLSYSGDEHENASYHCYAKDILAVGAGTVVAVKDGIPENIPHSNKPAVPITYETVGGNYVVLNLGHNRYAFYAHMIPGSLKVKPGDKVKMGQVIGKLGNTGNSSEPHLHFHVVDAPQFLAANGVPYAFDNFYIYNAKVISQEPFKVQILDTQLQHMINQLVLEDTMVKFPG